MRPVVHDFTAADRAHFQEINAQPFAAAQHVVHANAAFAHFHQGAIAQIV